jgi:hypothetical protein
LSGSAGKDSILKASSQQRLAQAKDERRLSDDTPLISPAVLPQKSCAADTDSICARVCDKVSDCAFLAEEQQNNNFRYDISVVFTETVQALEAAVGESIHSSGPLTPPLSPSFAHDLPCSHGKTALKWAINWNKGNVVAYLRSIGAGGAHTLYD